MYGYDHGLMMYPPAFAALARPKKESNTSEKDYEGSPDSDGDAGLENQAQDEHPGPGRQSWVLEGDHH